EKLLHLRRSTLEWSSGLSTGQAWSPGYRGFHSHSWDPQDHSDLSVGAQAANSRRTPWAWQM
ncbi:hypothetical protein CEXT_184901, partial [Caerostris extrusa]